MIENKHTFAICAYKHSPYLEECIHSLLAQTIKSNIIICTSTPSQYIEQIAQKYHLPYYINREEPGIGSDWNFAYEQASTQYVTIAHQDDIYFPAYTEYVLNESKKSIKPIIIYSEYTELRNGQQVANNKLLWIKKIMNSPLRIKKMQSLKCIRKIILAFGNPICCPAVTFNKEIIGDRPFNTKMRNSLDWEAWIRLADKEGDYIYLSQYLMSHRISELSETTQTIANGTREKEDFEMFCKFWSPGIARLLMKFYSKGMKSNQL